MTNKIFKLIRDCEVAHKQVYDNKVYVMLNRQTGEIISTPERKSRYYTSIKSLYNAYNRYINSVNAINKDDIAFREIKLADYDLTDEDNDILMNLINNNKINYSNKLFTQIVKYRNAFDINFIKENKSVKCRIINRQCKSDARRGVPLGYHVINCNYDNYDNYDEPYYFAETMPKLRELLLNEVKNGNIEIPEAGLYKED